MLSRSTVRLGWTTEPGTTVAVFGTSILGSSTSIASERGFAYLSPASSRRIHQTLFSRIATSTLTRSSAPLVWYTTRRRRTISGPDNPKPSPPSENHNPTARRVASMQDLALRGPSDAGVRWSAKFTLTAKTLMRFWCRTVIGAGSQPRLV